MSIHLYEHIQHGQGGWDEKGRMIGSDVKENDRSIGRNSRLPTPSSSNQQKIKCFAHNYALPGGKASDSHEFVLKERRIFKTRQI